MPRTKHKSFAERNRRKAARRTRIAAMREELLGLRLATTRVKTAATLRAENARQRDAFLDELYCGRNRAMLDEVIYQERARNIYQEWWERGYACGYKTDAVKPEHTALLAPYDLHSVTGNSKLPFEERLRLRHEELAAKGIYRGEYAKARRLESDATPMDTPPDSS